MEFKIGQRVCVEPESTSQRARYGTVRELIRTGASPRYQIEWDDGHTSIYTPAAGALHAVVNEQEAGAAG